MLRTRNREKRLVTACIEAKQSFVVDNTSPTKSDRARYIPAAKEAGFRVIGYYFASKIEECRERNAARPAGRVIPLPGLLRTHGRLELPEKNEGFDELYYVTITKDGRFDVSEWSDEV